MKRLVSSVFLMLLGCGGNVVVDHGSGGAGQGGKGNGGGIGGAGGINTTTATMTPVTSTNVTTTSSTGGNCNTCSQVLGGANPAQICGGTDSDAYNGLLGCVCPGGSACQAQCGANFCVHQAASGPCQACMGGACGADFAQCTGTTEFSSAVAGSTGSGMNCMTCSQFIQTGTDTSQLCPNSVSFYDDLATCICSGNCAPQCASTCNSGNTTQGCQNCVFKPDPKGCDDEWNACSSN